MCDVTGLKIFIPGLLLIWVSFSPDENLVIREGSFKPVTWFYAFS